MTAESISDAIYSAQAEIRRAARQRLPRPVQLALTHADESTRLLDLLVDPARGELPFADRLVAMAQVHATLAVAYATLAPAFRAYP